MIISFTYRYIFLKTQKVGGESMENALYERFFDHDHDLCHNFRIVAPHKTPKIYPEQYQQKIQEGLQAEGPHMTGRRVKAMLGDAYHDFFVFSIERNPFTRMVSLYFYTKHIYEQEKKRRAARGEPYEAKDPSSFREWLLTVDRPHFCRNRGICSLHEDKPYDGVNFIIRYEHMAYDVTQLSRCLGFRENIYDTYRTMSKHRSIRPQGMTACHLFSGFDEGIARVRKECAIELDTFGYDAPTQKGVSGMTP
ncbi:MAG: sulfotransferase family 2 domain-containing protein [Alphaproteobacteria bacterium GM7ARS4]|nr:sulfotransferase family 2 domain-containing protein [Alphaproteobacteria bacterium GM7ARS4]